MLGNETFFTVPTITGNSSTAPINLPSAGLNLIEVFAGAGVNFGAGGTVNVQFLLPDGAFWTGTPAALGAGTFNSATANTFIGRYYVYGPQMRFTVTGATAAAAIDLNVRASEVRETQALAASAPNGGLMSLPAGVVLTSNGTSAVFTVPDTAGITEVAVLAAGTFGGGTLTLQTSPDGGTTWFNCAAGITGPNTIVFGTPQVIERTLTSNVSRLFRLSLTGATNPSIRARLV